MQLASSLGLAAFAAATFIAARRSRVYLVFSLVVLGIPTFVAHGLGSRLGALHWGFLYFQLAACVHFLALALWPNMRPTPFRVAISFPALWFAACSLLAWPWALTATFGATPHGWWIPFALGVGGLVQSLHTREETVTATLDRGPAGPLARHPLTRPNSLAAVADARPLRIVQITDPHLGPFMTVERLRRICTRAVEREPDLVLLTGDLMTLESHDVEIVSAALEPLSRMRGRVFACHGNHDHEARQVIAEAYRRTGVHLLIDEATVVRTEYGPVQIVGADFTWRGRDVHLAHLAAAHPRREGVPRVWLLHDPGAFHHIPDGEADLVLSGHTHGGQVGLLSLGGKLTFVSALTRIPDHGLWAHGRNRLYVHRAQGHYGFPIRLGVPAEESLMQVHFESEA